MAPELHAHMIATARQTPVWLIAVRRQLQAALCVIPVEHVLGAATGTQPVVALACRPLYLLVARSVLLPPRLASVPLAIASMVTAVHPLQTLPTATIAAIMASA